MIVSWGSHRVGEECCYRFLRIYKIKERRWRTLSPIGRGGTRLLLVLASFLFTLRDLPSHDGGNGAADDKADEEAPDEAAFPLLASASEEHERKYSITS